ncbi:hypothetical protein BDP27DRAFT_1234871 [Rhodocollybia butyracea]|uniref:Uncharacterized protein n=1 Tax=Rhodocollybia butyracea TaxID=206335 RepID=A0A9P5PFE2_9AGAR|nr:hypothetical protein BDP27DRAFT_1234871 [Rhodocollybia butyracea]
MAVPFDVTAAQLVAQFLECITYGIYLVTLAQCLYALLFERSHEFRLKKKINWTMLVVTLLLCVFATIDVAIGLRHNLVAFVYFQGPGGPIAVFSDISNWINIMKTVDYVAQTFIGDGMLIYRCYIVYGRNWKVIVLSVLLWLGGAVCGALVADTYATLKSAALIDTSQAVPFVDSMVALSLTTNVITTGLIVWKIWSVDKESASLFSGNGTGAKSRPSKLHRAMRIIIDSALLYTVTTIIFVITYAVGSNANYGTSDMVVQTIGISFNLIIVRVEAGKSYDGNLQSDNLHIPTSLVHQRGAGFRRQRELNGFPMSQFQTVDHSFQSNTLPAKTELSDKGVALDVEVVHHYSDERTIGNGSKSWASTDDSNF